jgi:putative flavoprotein involved in K+ transport
MTKKIETVIIGGGQGGLATSYFLTLQGREHIVLEAANKPAHAWRNDRWDSFTLVTPNWAFRLPGAEYAGPDPDGFMPRQEVVNRFERYVDDYQLPVQFGVRALAVKPIDPGYRVETDRGEWEAVNVVVATGLFQKPRIPAWSAGLPADLVQLPCGRYRNPEALPPGAVLVAGSGQSGCQIAEELYQAGRKVYLCVGSAGRAPRRYRGRDVNAWLYDSGFMNRTPDQLPSPQARFSSNPQVTGKDGGHTLNLHQFYRDGVVLLGRLQTAQDGVVHLAGDLKENLAKGDALEENIVKMIDGYIEKAGIDAPQETLPNLQDGYSAPEIRDLDLKAAGITAIIWSQGYTFDFGLVKAPVFDEAGFPLTEGGITRYPGLYFAGMPWLPGQSTGLLLGVGENAKRVAADIVARSL